MSSLTEAAKILVKTCAAVAPKEEVLILADTAQDQQILNALTQAAQQAEAKSKVLQYHKLGPGNELPRELVEALNSVDVVFACGTEPFSFKHFYDCTAKGVRVLSMFRITTSSLIRTVPIDYQRLAEELNTLSERLSKSKQVEIRSQIGSNLTIELAGRTAKSSTGLATQKGQWTSIPAGIVSVAPKEFTSKGRLFIDGTIIGIGRVLKPIMAVIQRGRLTDLAYDQSYPMFRQRLSIDDSASILSQVGIGTNPKAKMIGGSEDERVRGTVYVGFGDNKLFEGNVTSKSHMDATMLKGTLTVDGKALVEGGHLLTSVD